MRTNIKLFCLFFFIFVSCARQETTEEKWATYRQKTSDTTQYYNVDDPKMGSLIREMMEEEKKEEEGSRAVF